MLPPLPKQNKHKEADFGITLKHWVEKHPLLTSSSELKQTSGKDSLLFSEVKQEQIAYALKISSDKGAWIRTLGLDGAPDYIWLRNEIAYIWIKYPKGYVGITIGNFLFEKEKSKRKSLTWDRAVAIASIKIQKTPH